MANNRDVCHAWAHQHNEARSGSNLFHENGKLYSYGHHFMIGRHTTDKQGNPCILFTTSGYSNTTAKHISYARQALPGYKPVYYVPNPEANGKESHIENLRAMFQEIVDDCDKFTRARIRDYSGDITHMAQSFKQYVDGFCNLGWLTPALREFYDDYTDATAEVIVEKITGIQKRDSSSIKRRRNAARKKQIERDTTSAMESIRKFREGGQRMYLDRHKIQLALGVSTDLLRVNPDDPQEIQTSQYVSVSVPQAKRLYDFSFKFRGAEQGWQRNGETFKIDRYYVDTIDTEGSIKAGCHIIHFDEIDRIAKELGWTD